MPRGRRKSGKIKIKKENLRLISAVLALLLGAVSAFSFFVDSSSLISIVKDYQFEFFGLASYGLPVAFVVLAVILFDFVELPYINFKGLSGLLLLLISVMGLSALLGSDTSGGFLGYELYVALKSSISTAGALVVFALTTLASLIIILDIPLSKIWEAVVALKEKIPFAKPNFSLPKISVPAKGDAAYEEGDEEDPAFYPTKKSKVEPTFEVIEPSLEPVDPKANKRTVGLDSVSARGASLGGLPYTDRVWEYPPIDMLSDFTSVADRGDVNGRRQVIERTLAQFGIKSKVVETNFGPAVTQYGLEITSVTKIAKVTNLQNDLALALASPTGSVRIEAPIPGKTLIGIEVPNISTAIVNFKSMISSDVMKASKSKLTIAMGHNVAGQPIVADISKMPHLLIAGSTGSGKSVFLHSVLFSLLYRCSPAECKLIIVDPKRVELVNYGEIPHLLVPPITDAEKAPNAFRWAVSEMERRYKLFENAKVRNITAYNELSGFQALSYIVIVVDELAELMALQPGEMEKSICRLAQLSRATGIHLVLATQSPRVDVITGLIKANIPSRIAFGVSSQIESRIIIDTNGAEKLLGKGDMLYVPPETSKPVRIQGVFISDKEINNLVSYLKDTGVKPEYKEDVVKASAPKSESFESSDELFNEAVKIITVSDKASASLLQRKLSIGYARAARLIDELEAKGIVGGADGSKPRDVLIRNHEAVSNSAPQE